MTTAGEIDLDRRTAAGRRLELGERQRRQRQIGADQHCGRQNRERIVDQVPARRTDLVGELGAQNLRDRRRAVRMRHAFDQPRVGLGVRAERYDAPDAGFLGAAVKLRKLRNIAIDDGGAVGFEAEKNLGFGGGDLGQRAEKLEMHRRDRGDQGDMRPRQARQRRDLARVIHAHFKHGVARARRTAGER
jgi:hypothetical protein